MKQEKTRSTKAARKQLFRTWGIRICAILLVVLMLVGTFYYTLAALLG
jgi:t-SNARE complex subunit (syntaxin)